MVLLLAMPVVATNMLQALIGYVDVRMVSELGGEALAALSVGQVTRWIVMSVFIGVSTGITAYVSRLTGQGEHERARAYATVGVIVGACLGLGLTLIGLVLGPGPVQRMVTSEGSVLHAASVALTRAYAWDYMSVLLLSFAGMGVQFAATSVFNSLGRTAYPMWLLLLYNALNFAGNLLLIPRYQVAGCAWSTTGSTYLIAIAAVFLLVRQGALSKDIKRLATPLRKAWEMVKVGLPVAVNGGLVHLSHAILLKLITLLPNSVIGQGAWQVGIQAEGLAFMPGFAFSVAAATLTGQNLGARKIHQVRQSAMACLLGNQAVMWGMGLLLWFNAEWFVRLFIGQNAPEVVAPAASFLRILCYCLPGMGLRQTLFGVLRGAGDTPVMMWITFLERWVVRMPLAVFLAMSGIMGTALGLGWGLDGIWWGMTLSVYVGSVLAWERYASNRWSKVSLSHA